MMLASAELVGFVPVSDMARARAFYEGVLGCVLVDGDDYGCELTSNGRPVRLARVETEARPPYTVLGWAVPDLAGAVRALTGSGVTFTRYEGMGQDDLGIWTAPSGDRVAWFSDSEGNALSLSQAG
jgi:catechol 2,3-dioxygenase-like lactoylglutathione lyase family enzyme